MVGFQSSFVLDRKEGRIEFSWLWEPQSCKVYAVRFCLSRVGVDI
jgi:hypothetical protein